MFVKVGAHAWFSTFMEEQPILSALILLSGSSRERPGTLQLRQSQRLCSRAFEPGGSRAAPVRRTGVGDGPRHAAMSRHGDEGRAS